jgi:hypothetical protein
VGSTDFYSCRFISFGIRAQFPIRSYSIFFFPCLFDPSSHCSRVTKKKKGLLKIHYSSKVFGCRITYSSWVFEFFVRALLIAIFF